jgi:hypothetical protein
MRFVRTARTHVVLCIGVAIGIVASAVGAKRVAEAMVLDGPETHSRQGVDAAPTCGVDDPDDASWTKDFAEEKSAFSHTGRSPYFILEPGYVLLLEGGKEQITITVLDETKTVDGVVTRVVEERETKDGQLVEVSRNYFAISKRTNSVYYFGEDVDIYKDGKVVKHEGAWLSGEKGARFGLMTPGLPLMRAKYYQEIAPGAAMDRAEIIGMHETVQTPAGEFKDCLKVEETTPLEPGEKEYKYYAAGIGLVQDGSLKLMKHGPGGKR